MHRLKYWKKSTAVTLKLTNYTETSWMSMRKSKPEERLSMSNSDLLLPPQLATTWDEIRDYMSSSFATDEKDYHETYMERYAQVRGKSN